MKTRSCAYQGVRNISFSKNLVRAKLMIRFVDHRKINFHVDAAD